MWVLYIYGHMHRVIVGLSKSFSKSHNAETSLEQAQGVKDLPFTFEV